MPLDYFSLNQLVLLGRDVIEEGAHAHFVGLNILGGPLLGRIAHLERAVHLVI